jgi:hypothetical protein
MAIIIIIGTVGLLFLIAWIYEQNITMPSDGLVGMICGELRSGAAGWEYEKDLFGFSYNKDNISVSYSVFMDETATLFVNEEIVKISPSSRDALLKILKVFKKNLEKAEKAEKQTRELRNIIEASERMLRD